MNRNKGIQLDMQGYRPNKRTMTQQEKIERLFKLAKELNVQVGEERDQHDRDDGVLSKRPRF